MTPENTNCNEFKDYEILTLDEDEAQHLKQVSHEIAESCALANSGGMLIACCITWTPTLERTETSSPDLIKGLLAMKCANLIRLGTTAILIGYYTGAAILLRAAFESLAYFGLFDDEPDEIGLWLKLELHPDLNPQERDEFRRDQFNRARKSFVQRAPDEKRERELIKFLWDKASGEIHSSVVGLAQSFGLDFRDFLPDDFWLALEKGGDDWGFALDMLSLKALDGKTWSLGRYGQLQDREEVILLLIGRYDEDEALLLSQIALFLAHRLADLVFTIFEVTNPDLQADFDRWHKEVKRV